MAALRAPLAYFVVFGQHAIHRALGTVVYAFVERRRVQWRNGEIDEAVFMQHREHAVPLDWRQGPRWRWAWLWDRRLRAAAARAKSRRRGDAHTRAPRAQRPHHAAVRGDGLH